MVQADSILPVTTPEGVEFALFPAGLPARSCAYAIDQIIQWVLLTVLVSIFLYLGQFGGIWIFLLLYFLIDWFYHFLFEVFLRGSSPGKKIMGIRVVRGDGSPVNPGASFLRNLLRFADTFLFLYLIAFISMAVSKGFRRIGDWAADTVVVYTAKTLAAPRLPASGGVNWLESFDPVVSPRPLSFDEKQAVVMFARRFPLLGEDRADEIAMTFVKSLMAGGPAAGNNNMSGKGSAARYILGLARTIGGVF
jgi:uncharacterized RDD family membrane protein YckC